jgi:hypothetical protein
LKIKNDLIAMIQDARVERDIDVLIEGLEDFTLIDLDQLIYEYETLKKFAADSEIRMIKLNKDVKF